MQDDSEHLDETSLTVLRIVHGLLRDRGRWPTFAVVDRRLDHHGIDAQAALAAVPRRYLRQRSFMPSPRDDDDISLTLPGVAATGEADDDLALLTRFVQWLVRTERTHDPDETGQPLVVTSEQAAAQLGLDVASDQGQATIRRVWSLIELIPLISAGTSCSQDGSCWQLTVSREIRSYRDLSGPGDLVRRVGDYWRHVDESLAGVFPATDLPAGSSTIEGATSLQPGIAPAVQRATDTVDASDAVRPELQPEQADLLASLVEASRRVPQDRRGSFLLEQVQEGAYLIHRGLDGWKLPCHPGDVRVLHRLGLVVAEDDDEPRVDVTPQGVAYVGQMRRQSALQPIREAADSYTGTEQSGSPGSLEKTYDVFICHAGEDKDAVARPLATALQALGLAVWFDEFELKIGDSLRGRIDDGLAGSRFGVVVLSSAFFDKRWPRRELDGLVTRQMAGDRQIILPIWHNVTHEDVMRFSLPLADTVARATRDTPLADIAAEIAEVVRVRDCSIRPTDAASATAGIPASAVPERSGDEYRPQKSDGGLVHQELTAPLAIHELSGHLTTVDFGQSVDTGVVTHDEPPADWGAQYWRGKQILRCPFCGYRTISSTKFAEHSDAHLEPPTPDHAQRVYGVPMAWAKVPIHYIGDGPYLNGVPADSDHTLYTSDARAHELVATGLYDLGPLGKQEHALRATGRTLVCKCGFEAATTPEFQAHLASAERESKPKR